MISQRSRSQLKNDVSSFFGDFRTYVDSSGYNMGLGEITCKNMLVEDLSQYFTPYQILSRMPRI